MTYRYRQLIEEGGGLTYLRKEFKLTPSELLVLTNLIKHDHPVHGCFPKQETIAHETGLHKTQVWRAVNGLEEKGLYTRVKKPYRDARGRVRAGKIHHYEFAEVVERALEYAGKAFDEAREAERNGRLPEKELTDFAEGGAGQEDCPMVHNNGMNGQSKADGAAPDSSQYANPIVHNKGADASRIVNQTVHNSGSEKLEVEVASKNWKRDSRSAAAGAAVHMSSTDAVRSGNGEAASRGAGLYEQTKAAGREERAAAAALARKREPVPERKRCECGAEIPPEKADSRDECRDCYYARVRREEEERRAEEDEQRRLGFLEGRDRGRPQRGLFNRGKTTGPLPAGGEGGGPLSGGEGHASGAQ